MRLLRPVVFLIFLSYCAITSLPASSLWFNPGLPTFTSVDSGEVPELSYSRAIYQPVLIQYSAVVRDLSNGQVVCEGSGGPMLYRRNFGQVLGETLGWWVPSDPRCLLLPPGSYEVSTTWQVIDPLTAFLPSWLDEWLGWIVPPKRVTRVSPPFMVYSNDV